MIKSLVVYFDKLFGFFMFSAIQRIQKSASKLIY